ncbi:MULTISPECIES: TdeIII family type II restriction endonuclease [Bacillus cereus group]|uniref:TdeIII family type II restriction endonuclease n=1 Tax=Bacillus cereus group TaxID=86661 RepID=UPI000BED5FC3|nr:MULTISPECIES: TdeIII family type II restriction endonuclease [Bacillus cereus group]PED94924.1 hypothetical protein CON90_10345 [Bacillus toyonensis]PEL58721.1 hypothetical protein CN633_16040 [Bacillus toyonensis]PEO73342.1 hypothetical protein CN570_28655 [Bacillus toyonensis]PGB84107.1 hypothetical protein COM03_06355 [Bacillus wiedmannii]
MTNKETKQRLREYLKLIIGSVFNRISEIESEYLDEEVWKNKNPFLSRITPVEVSRAARFERVINNKMAQGVYENITKIIVEGTGAKAIIQYKKTININT